MNIYTGNFVADLQNFPMPEIPEDAVWNNRNDGELNPFYKRTHSDESKALMKAKRAKQIMRSGWNHTDETKERIRQKAVEQFKDPKNKELQRQKSLEQFKDLEQRYKAGNGTRGKSWYCNHETGHTILCFPCDKPDNYVKGRIYK